MCKLITTKLKNISQKITTINLKGLKRNKKAAGIHALNEQVKI